MNRSTVGAARAGRLLASACFGAVALAACADQPVAPLPSAAAPPSSALQAFDCTATRESMSCTPASPRLGDARGTMFGGQNTLVRLTSSNASYDEASEMFTVDVTVQNLMNEAIGTPDGVTPDPLGVMVFFMTEPAATGLSVGDVAVNNPTGTAFFTNADQAYHTYHGILAKDQVSPVKTWEFKMPSTVAGFRFTVLLETSIQPLLVINELGVNPGGTIYDANGEWVEIYNAGSYPVDLQGLVMADSAASGRRPFNLIASSVVIQPGGYAVLGNTTNTTDNGGVPVNYAYGAGMAFANSLDAFKIARVVGTDTLTLDRVQYASAAVSAQNGISRELKNPALDNANMDGSNWGDATVQSVLGSWGRGTPGAQNSVFTP